MAPKVTIVVPVYNGEQFLPACIESICAQTWTDFECVMVNDGSSDGSGAICDEVSRRDSRFRVIHQENGGLSRARNAGMRVSRGEYYLLWLSLLVSHPKVLKMGQHIVQNKGMTPKREKMRHVKETEDAPE